MDSREKKNPLARARIIISDLTTQILVNMLTTLSHLPYTKRLFQKFSVEEMHITWKSNGLKEHVSVMCTFEFSTGPVTEHVGIHQLFLSL